MADASATPRSCPRIICGETGTAASSAARTPLRGRRFAHSLAHARTTASAQGRGAHSQRAGKRGTGWAAGCIPRGAVSEERGGAAMCVKRLRGGGRVGFTTVYGRGVCEHTHPTVARTGPTLPAAQRAAPKAYSWGSGRGVAAP